MRIGELATKTGLTAPTLRFYEEQGLLHAASRTAAGYRTYGPEALGRLTFIARAKALGLSLEQIKELLDICSGEDCDASMERLRHIVAHKIEEVGRQIAEQVAFKRELEHAYARMSEHARAGALGRELKIIGSTDCVCNDSTIVACDPSCGCCAHGEVSDEAI